MNWINLYKGFLMILVYLGHTNLVNESILKVIQAFHMPAFFIVSGYLFKCRSWKEVLSKRFKRLIVPFWSMAVFYFLIWSIVNYPYDIKDYIIECLLGRLTYLWFLPCMFFATVMYSLIYNSSAESRWLHVKVIICVLVGYFLSYTKITMPYYLDSAAVAVGYIHIGHMMRTYNLLGKVSSRLYRIIAPITLVLVIILVIIIPGRLDMRVNSMTPILFRFPVSVFLSFVTMKIAKKIDKNAILEFVGKNSLDFYALGVFVPNTVRYIFGQIGLDGTMLSIINKVLSIGVIFLLVLVKQYALKYYRIVTAKHDV